MSWGYTADRAHVTGLCYRGQSGTAGWIVSATCKCGWKFGDSPDDGSVNKAAVEHIHSVGGLTYEEDLAKRDVVSPFPNGTSYMDWSARNCERCLLGYDEEKREWRCELEKAINAGAMDDGTMSRELAVRAGLATKPFPRDCPERVPN
jgi:hypothetical protein